MPANFHVILASRPGLNGEPTVDNFRHESCPYPNGPLQPGEVIIKTLYLSVDPALRCCMNEDTGVHYLKPWLPGHALRGLSGIGVIIESMSPQLKPGDLVHCLYTWPWKLYYVRNSDSLPTLEKVPDYIADTPSLLLSVFGVTGFTALLGIREKGHIKKGGNQTCVVSAAAGSTGSLAGQFAKLEGCKKVVGICGTDEKKNLLVKEFGFDGAINYKDENVDDQLKILCPNGVDVYFDNVGGKISDSVIKNMNKNSHVILSGQIALYNKDVQYPPQLPEETQKIVNEMKITRERFLVLNYAEKYEATLEQLMKWFIGDKIKYRECIDEGLYNAGKAFVRMMNGGNIGKQIIHVDNP